MCVHRFQEAAPGSDDVIVDTIAGPYKLAGLQLRYYTPNAEYKHVSTLLHRFQEAAPGPYDVIVDTVGGPYEPAGLQLLKPWGRGQPGGHYVNLLTHGWNERCVLTLACVCVHMCMFACVCKGGGQKCALELRCLHVFGTHMAPTDVNAQHTQLRLRPLVCASKAAFETHNKHYTPHTIHTTHTTHIHTPHLQLWQRPGPAGHPGLCSKGQSPLGTAAGALLCTGDSQVKRGAGPEPGVCWCILIERGECHCVLIAG